MAKLLGHLIWFDFRAHRALLALFAAASVGQALVLITGPDATSNGGSSGLSWDLGLLIVRGGLMMAVVARLVHSDGVVGTQSFWMTRPIPRWTLLASKLLQAVAWLVVLPALTTAAALAFIGMAGADAAWGGAVMAIEQTVILAMILMAAVVTADYAQLVVAGIAGVTLVSLLNYLILPVITFSWPALGERLAGWQPTVYSTVVIAGALVVAAHQYLTLKAWRTLALVALTMVLATGLTRAWPKPLHETDEQAVPASLFSGNDLVLSVASQSPQVQTVDRVDRAPFVRDGAAEPPRPLRVSFEIVPSGGTKDVALWPVSAHTRIVVPGESPVEWSGDVESRPSRSAEAFWPPGETGSEGPPISSIRAALGNTRLLGPPPGWVYMTDIAEISAAVHRRCRTVPCGVDGTLTYDVYRYAVSATAALTPGSRIRVRNRIVSIVSVTRSPLGVHVELRETAIFQQGGANSSYNPIVSYFVVRNPSKKQALLGSSAVATVSRFTVFITSNSLSSATVGMNAEVVKGDGSRATIDDEWIRGAELLIVEPIKLGAVTRPLKIDRLVPVVSR